MTKCTFFSRVRRILAPAFLLFSLAAPNVIYIVDLFSERAGESSGVILAACAAALVSGTTLLLLGAAFTLYHFSVARRLIHFLLFVVLLDVFYRLAYHGPVTPGLLLAVPQTSQLETFELLAGHPALTASLSVVMALCAGAVVAGWPAPAQMPRSVRMYVVAAGLSLLAFAVAGTHWLPLEFTSGRQTLAATTSGIFPIDVAMSFGAVAKSRYRAGQQDALRSAFRFPDPHLRNAQLRLGREIYVVVVGETSRRQNWSLFGYPRQTNPYLSQIAQDLVPYRMMSNATNTVLSLPMALTRATPATRDLIGSEKSIVALLRQAGFETYWISNQERPILSSNPILRIAKEAQHVSFRDGGLQGPAADRFDTNLLTRLDAAMTQTAAGGKVAIFLHMEGSHFSYKERYPPEFERFAGADHLPNMPQDGRQRLIDEYDNTIVLTDYVLSRVVNMLSSCNCAAGMVYFSDHGERLFDRGPTDGEFGHGFPGVARQEIEVPFVAWLSPLFQRTNPALAGRLKTNAQWVAELHNVFETIVDLAGIEYGDRAATLSLFSEGWRRPTEVSVLGLDDSTVLLPIG